MVTLNKGKLFALYLFQLELMTQNIQSLLIIYHNILFTLANK